MGSSRSDGLDFARKLPVLFVCSIIVFLFIAYSFFHCLPLLQLDVPAEHRIHSDVVAGTWQLSVFLPVTALLLACYVRSIVEPAGGIPDTPEWMAGMSNESAELPANVQETKGDGGRRKCKWCAKYKPDRCHHCRVCRACVLKMDHHCPWIYNCVGFSNHKYFFLLLLYSVIDTHLIAWTMWMTVQKTTQHETSFGMMFVVLFAESLASFLAIITTLFLGFHIWLMMNGMTTIEYCEKTLKKENYNQSVWDLGFGGNLKAVFGPNPVLWFLPLSPPTGDGINYVNEGSRLTIDLENGRGLRRQHIQERRRRRKRPSDAEDLITPRQDDKIAPHSMSSASSSLHPVRPPLDISAPSGESPP